jgi:hypothetical protein
VHPRSGETLRFEQPLPPDLATWLDRLRAAAGIQPAASAPAAETLAAETLAAETPAAETPVAATLAAETPVALPDSDG